MKLFSCHISSDTIWIRIPAHGYGLTIKKTDLLFSERNGYKKYLKLPFGWRLSLLKPVPDFLRLKQNSHKELRNIAIEYGLILPRFSTKSKKRRLIQEAISKRYRDKYPLPQHYNCRCLLEPIKK